LLFMYYEMLLERKNIDFDISRNLLIKEVENEFISIFQKSIFPLTYKQYRVKYFYLENKKAFEKMLIGFYLEHLNSINEITKIGDIQKAKTKINKLTSSIEKWFEEFIKNEAETLLLYILFFNFLKLC